MPEQQHAASTEFWAAYQSLPQQIRDRADKQFALLKENPQHPSLQLKKLGERNSHEIWSARVTLQYRALAIKRPGGFLWFWIGDHKTYDSLIG
jgi:hypothetical protein